MAGRTATATVQISGFTLRLSPLSRRDWAKADRLWKRLALSILAKYSEEWFNTRVDALDFIFISARKNKPDLSLADLHDGATNEEIENAITYLVALGVEREGQECRMT